MVEAHYRQKERNSKDLEGGRSMECSGNRKTVWLAQIREARVGRDVAGERGRDQTKKGTVGHSSDFILGVMGNWVSETIYVFKS